jgi:hypothetical protein
MRVLSSLAVIALAAFSFSEVAAAARATESPLVGTWVLCQDPDGSPKDTLEFFSEGYGFSRRSNAPMSPFLFKEAKDQLLLAVNAHGNLLNIYMGVSPDHSRLTLKSERTGNEAYYVRVGQEKQNGCTAK